MRTPKNSASQKFQLHHLLLLIGLALLFSGPLVLLLSKKVKQKSAQQKQETPAPRPDSAARSADEMR